MQLREKDLEGGPLYSLAVDLRGLTREFDAKLLVNDRIDVALAADADGVVLPASSFTTAEARRLLGPDKILARSTHSAAEVERAAREPLDFVLFGPIHATPSKTGAPQGIERLREAARLGIAVYAVGGITAENAREAIGVGAAGVAVIRAAMEGPGVVGRLIATLGGPGAPGGSRGIRGSSHHQSRRRGPWPRSTSSGRRSTKRSRS